MASASDSKRGPLSLSARSWWGAVKRSASEFRKDNLTDWAAALTYYAVLSLFPGLIVLVALTGLLGQYPQTTDAILEIIDDVGPQSAVDTFREPVEGVVRNKGGAGALLGVGLVAAIWTASGYIGAFTRAANAIYEVEEGRSAWKLRPIQLAITFVAVMLLALLAIAVVLTGDLADAVGERIGFGNSIVTVWSLAKWPLLALAVMTMFSGLYYLTPNVRHRGFGWITPGSVLAVLLWVIASVGFSFYVANFGSYNETYGSLGAVIVFLIWLWISNMALLLGAEFNAEIERSRELEAGVPEEETIAVEPRGAPDL